MKHSLRNALLFAIAMLLAGLAACAPRAPQWEVGFDALSPNGDWGTYTEHSGDPAAWRLGLLNLQSGESLILADGLEAPPHSTFSPNEPYLIYQVSDRWFLINYSSTDPASNRQEILASEDGNKDEKSQKLLLVQFLPDGELLLMVQGLDSRKNLYTIRDLDGDINRPEIRSIQASRVRYAFPGEGAPDIQTGFSQLVSSFVAGVSSSTGKVAGCSVPGTLEAIRWALVDESYNVRILVASRSQGVNLEGTLPRLSEAVQSLLQEEEKDIEAEVTRQIQDQAKKDGKELSPADLQAQVQEQLRLNPSPPSVFISPVKKKLLYLRVRSASGDLDVNKILADPVASLYLVDLEAPDRMGASGMQRSTLFDVKGLLLPSFSPDGSKVLVLHIQAREEKSLYSLYLVDLGAVEIAPITLSKQTNWAPGFTFSPDGRQILYEADLGNGKGLYLANADSSNPTRLGNQPITSFCWYR